MRFLAKPGCLAVLILLAAWAVLHVSLSVWWVTTATERTSGTPSGFWVTSQWGDDGPDWKEGEEEEPLVLPPRPAVHWSNHLPGEWSASHAFESASSCPAALLSRLQELDPVWLPPRPTDPCTDVLPVLQYGSDSARVVIYVHTSFRRLHSHLWHSMRTWVRLANGRVGVAVVPVMSAESVEQADAFKPQNMPHQHVPDGDLTPQQLACLWKRGVRPAVHVLDNPRDAFWLELVDLDMIASTKEWFPAVEHVVRVSDDAFVQIDPMLAFLGMVGHSALFTLGQGVRHAGQHRHCHSALIAYPASVLPFINTVDMEQCYQDHVGRDAEHQWKAAPGVLATVCLEVASAIGCRDAGNKHLVWDWDAWRSGHLGTDPVDHVPVDVCAVVVDNVRGGCFEVMESGGNVSHCDRVDAHLHLPSPPPRRAPRSTAHHMKNTLRKGKGEGREPGTTNVKTLHKAKTKVKARRRTELHVAPKNLTWEQERKRKHHRHNQQQQQQQQQEHLQHQQHIQEEQQHMQQQQHIRQERTMPQHPRGTSWKRQGPKHRHRLGKRRKKKRRKARRAH